MVWARSDRALEDGSFGGVARRQSRAQSQLVHTANPKTREHTEVAAGVSLEVASACSVRAADARRREEIEVRWGDTLDHGETNVRYVCLQVRCNQVDGAKLAATPFPCPTGSAQPVEQPSLVFSGRPPTLTKIAR